MSEAWTPWASDSSEDPPEYDSADDGPAAQMWRSIASAAESMGYHQASCPACNGRGWLWVTDHPND